MLLETLLVLQVRCGAISIDVNTALVRKLELRHFICIGINSAYYIFLCRIPCMSPMPPLDVWNENGASEEYKVWATEALKSDPNYGEIFHFLSCFGHTLGIEDITFTELENALINSSISGVMADIMSRTLKCLGCSANQNNWVSQLRDLMLDDEEEDMLEVNRWVRRFAAVPYPRGRESVAGDDDANSSKYISFLMLPLPLKTLIWKTLNDMLLTCEHKNNS